MPRTPDRQPGIRIEDAMSIQQGIDDEFVVPDGATMLVDDPEIELTGSIDIPLTGNVVVL